MKSYVQWLFNSKIQFVTFMKARKSSIPVMDNSNAINIEESYCKRSGELLYVCRSIIWLILHMASRSHNEINGQ